jgi:Fe-S-cluster containining protein
MAETPAPSSAVEVSFALRIGEGTLNASLEVPAGKTTLTELLPILQNFDSNIINFVVGEAAGAGHPISCRKGCGACCRQMVPLSIFEAEFLSNWFSTLPPERQAELEERFRRGLMKLRDAGVLDKIMDQNWGADQKSFIQMSIDYFHANVPCPFLEDESCSIHPIRPLICREYLVTSPAELCQDPSINQISAIHLPIMPSKALYKIGQELTRDVRGWMPLIFLLAWAKRGVKPGDYYSGTGQEVLRIFMDNLTTEPPAEGATLMQPV